MGGTRPRRGAALSAELVGTLLLAAVLVFWVIGAHNRLVAMRNTIAAHWARVQDALNQRASAVAPLLAALREPMAAEQAALDTWANAHSEAAKAAAALTSGPVHEGRAQAWVAAEAALAAATSRVTALIELHRELAGQDSITQPLATWREGQAKLPFARQYFNDAAQAYNDAIAVFPTSLVAKGLRLGAAGSI